MRYNLLKSKLSQEAGTLSWIFGTFIILVIMGIYVFLTGALFVARGGMDNGQFDTSSMSMITENLIDFLHSDAGEYGTFYDLAVRADISDDSSDARLKIWKNATESFLRENFPGGSDSNPSYSAWIRIYSSDSEVQQFTDLTGFQAKYNIQRVWWGRQTSDSCSPHYFNRPLKYTREKADDYTDFNTVIMPLIPNKKIAVCWQNYADLGGGKK